ncbi:MAG: HAD-IC family P-type ATPase [Dehalococcoidales bacterium]|nr:HAD-IC family P-type ATPase [Dehalococcoidales bacterium]
MPTEDVIARLGTSHEGLSPQEASSRLERFGPNELESGERALPIVILLHQVRSPLIYILLVAAVVAFLLGKYIDVAFILVVVVLNSIVGFVQEYKAEQSLRALAQMTAPRARVLRDGREREIDAREVVPGDVVLLESGVKVPADLRLFRALELQVDESTLTGESLPVTKQTREIEYPNVPLGDRTNLAFLGTNVARGRGAGIVVGTGMATAFGNISARMREVGEVESPLQQRLGRFATLIALVVLGVTAVVFALGLLTGESLADILLTAVATAVAAVPEGLPVTITVALAVGVNRMARRQAIIRKLPSVETLGSCTTICSDKTGTLTKNEMTVRKVHTAGRVYEVAGSGYAPEGEISLDGRRAGLTDDRALALTLRIGLLCNESSVYMEDERYRAEGDPTEAALVVVALKGGLDKEMEEEAYRLIDEIPFESDRQYMATLHEHDGRRLVFVKGAPERVLGMCESAYVESTAILDRNAVVEQNQRLAAEGLRVLAMAYQDVGLDVEQIDHHDVEHGLVFAGLQGLLDPPREEAVEAVTKCKRAGMRVVMITGDHKLTAKAVADRMGISVDGGAEAIDGTTLEHMSDEDLFERVEEVSVYARAAPDHKLRVVRQLRRRGEVVAVTGDGVNDAPALKQADIGVAMGITGTDVAKEASDMVLADDNFATIYAAVEEGRIVFDNIRKVIMFLIPTGLGLVLTIIVSIAIRLPLPFLPAQVLWINLVTNGLQDVAMAFEPGEKDIGLRPPRDPREGMLTRLMIERTVLVGIVLLLGTLFTFTWQLTSGADLGYARTVAVTTMVLFQNFHIFNSRSFTRPFYTMNPFSNRFLLASIVAALGLQITALYWGPLQFILSIHPLALGEWLVIVPVAATVLLAVEVDKAVRRWLRRRQERLRS